MTNTVVPRNDRAFARLAVDLAKNPKELPTRDLRAQTASPTTATPSMSSKATATSGNHELHDVSPTRFARDFRLTFGELPSETLKRSAKRLISRSRSRPAALIRSQPKCKSPPVLADRDQQKS